MTDKTEYLFESDEEKAIIKKAILEEEKKRNKKKRIIIIVINIIFIIALGTGAFFASRYIINTKISKMIASDKNTIPSEKLNKYSDKLKQVTQSVDANKYEILVNKANPIKEEDLSKYSIVNVTDNMFNNIKLEEETYKNYTELKKHLKEKNYYINVRSGYRSFLESEELFNEYKRVKGLDYANKYVAKPGTSEHNTGLAMDILITQDENSIKNDYDSDEYYYLENIAYSYGFIIRYPKDKEKITGYSYEPWHLRYVGKELAKKLKKNNLTLEEYYEQKEKEAN